MIFSKHIITFSLVIAPAFAMIAVAVIAYKGQIEKPLGLFGTVNCTGVPICSSECNHKHIANWSGFYIDDHLVRSSGENNGIYVLCFAAFAINIVALFEMLDHSMRIILMSPRLINAYVVFMLFETIVIPFAVSAEVVRTRTFLLDMYEQFYMTPLRFCAYADFLGIANTIMYFMINVATVAMTLIVFVWSFIKGVLDVSASWTYLNMRPVEPIAVNLAHIQQIINEGTDVMAG